MNFFIKNVLSFLDEKCKHCFNYLSEIIKNNINSLNKRMSKPLKDDEISEIKNNENDLKIDENENVETLLEQVEYNINNQYKIQTQIWQNYYNF